MSYARIIIFALFSVSFQSWFSLQSQLARQSAVALNNHPKCSGRRMRTRYQRVDIEPEQFIIRHKTVLNKLFSRCESEALFLVPEQLSQTSRSGNPSRFALQNVNSHSRSSGGNSRQIHRGMERIHRRVLDGDLDRWLHAELPAFYHGCSSTNKTRGPQAFAQSPGRVAQLQGSWNPESLLFGSSSRLELTINWW